MERKDKLKQAGIKKYGSEELWRQAMREFGAMADRSTPRGFSMMKDKEKHREISKNASNIRWKKERARQEASDQSTTREVSA